MDDGHKAVRATVRRLRRAAADAARSPDADDDDKAALREAREWLAESAEEMIRIMNQNDALLAASALPQEAAARLLGFGPFIVSGGALTRLIYAAATIGSRALDNPAMLRELERMRETIEKYNAQRTAAAHKENLKKSAKRDEGIRKHVAMIVAEHPDLNWNWNKMAVALNGRGLSSLGLVQLNKLLKKIYPQKTFVDSTS